MATCREIETLPASLLDVSAPRNMPATVGANCHANSAGPSRRCYVRNTGAAATYRKSPAKLKASAPAFIWNTGDVNTLQ